MANPMVSIRSLKKVQRIISRPYFTNQAAIPLSYPCLESQIISDLSPSTKSIAVAALWSVP